MLRLDAEYYVMADKMGFILMHHHKTEKGMVAGRKTKDESETVVGYYPNVASCINRYRIEQMKNWIATEKMNLEQLCDRITELDATLKKKMRQLVEMEDKNESTEVGRVVVATGKEVKKSKKAVGKETGGKKDD